MAFTCDTCTRYCMLMWRSSPAGAQSAKPNSAFQSQAQRLHGHDHLSPFNTGTTSLRKHRLHLLVISSQCRRAHSLIGKHPLCLGHCSRRLFYASIRGIPRVKHVDHGGGGLYRLRALQRHGQYSRAHAQRLLSAKVASCHHSLLEEWVATSTRTGRRLRILNVRPSILDLHQNLQDLTYTHSVKYSRFSCERSLDLKGPSNTRCYASLAPSGASAIPDTHIYRHQWLTQLLL
ncbi:hypothetical protein BC834DRAFT_546461 [Gloeopeniophorella convolvens]|nr:hypothetical protein BC834DRAFT_546461 [Gloeopeniophorella convolvens]